MSGTDATPEKLGCQMTKDADAMLKGEPGRWQPVVQQPGVCPVLHGRVPIEQPCVLLVCVGYPQHCRFIEGLTRNLQAYRQPLLAEPTGNRYRRGPNQVEDHGGG